MQKGGEKTIEDYRNIIRLLKLKVIKLQKENEDLKKKLLEPFDDSFISSESVIGKYQQLDQKASQIQQAWKGHKQTHHMSESVIIQALAKGCLRIGLTPEALFRAADRDGKGEISVTQLKTFLQKARLGLQSSQADRIVQLANENLKGTISQQEWSQFLEVFQISQERSKDKQGDRTFSQQSIMKLANVLVQQSIAPETAFDMIDEQKQQVINCEMLKNFALKQAQDLSEREVMSAFIYLDYSKKGQVRKDQFISEIRKVMRVIAGEQNLKISTFCPAEEAIDKGLRSTSQTSQLKVQKPKSEFIQETPQKMDTILEKSPILKSPTKLNKSQLSNHSNKKQVEIQVLQVNEQEVLTYLENKKFNYQAFFSYLLENISNYKAGISYLDVDKAFNNTNKQIDKGIRLKFFRLLDKNSNGCADYDEVLEFYCNNMKNNWPIEPVYVLAANEITVLDTTTEKLIQDNNLTLDSSISNANFKDLASIIFKCSKPEIQSKIMKGLDQTGKGNFPAKAIVDKLNDPLGKKAAAQLNQSSVVAQKKVNSSAKSTQLKSAMGGMSIDINEFGETIQRLLNERIEQAKKNNLNTDFRFRKRWLNAQGDIEEKHWETILDDEVACLEKCYRILLEMAEKGEKKWCDPEFGPIETDPFGSKSMYFCDNDIAPGCPTPEEVKWLRPEEIIKELVDAGETKYEDCSIEFLEGGASSNDVKQSKYLGDCWFISALSLVASKDEFLVGNFVPKKETINKDLSPEEAKGMSIGVYPPCFHFLKPYGIYVLRFMKMHVWRYVILDDRLPCKEGGEIVYAQCRNANEIWVSLIEKAFAKLHGCYQSLISGDIAQGLADLTGLVPDKWKLENEKYVHGTAKQEDKDNLWNKLKQNVAEGTLMGCSAEGETEGFIDINGENSGVMSGHAYSVIDVFELDYLPDIKENKKNYHGNHRLLRIRNPWGYGEWKLKWSENEEERERLEKYLDQINNHYDQVKKKNPEAEDYKLGVDDGTFLMCFKSWRQLFANLFMCINFAKQWSGYNIKDHWLPEHYGVVKKGEQSAIDYANKNPQYIFEVKKKCTMYIQLSQHDGRLFYGEKYPYEKVMQTILLCIFKLNPGEKSLTKFEKEPKMIASNKKLNLRREDDSEQFTVEPGRYSIIPCTKAPVKVKSNFKLSIFYDCDKQDLTICKPDGSKLPPGVLDVIQEFEEGAENVSDDLKKLLKKTAASLLAEEEEELKHKKK